MAEKSIHPMLKLSLEIGPLAVFFVSFRYGEDLLGNPAFFAWLEPLTGREALLGQSGPLFVATACFMVAIATTLGVSWWLTRTLPRMAVLTAVVVAVFGGLTIWLQDETFIKMKPTIVNGLFALILGAGLLQGRSYLKDLMAESLLMDDRGWMLLTQRWVGFFVAMAVLNEIAWRSLSTETWVALKTFGYLPLTLVFMICQWPLLQRHMLEVDGEK